MIEHMLSIPISKDNAVSPVIGTILIIALTIVLVSISAVVFLGFDMAEPAPILGISIGQQGNVITVTHLNGEVLPAGTYKILVDGVDKTAEFGGTMDFGPGIMLSWDSGTEAVGTVSVVYTGTNGGETVLAQKNIGKAGSEEVVDHQILEINEVKYSLLDSVWDGGGEWDELLDEANESTTGSITLAENKIYYDGTYWWARNYHGYSLTTDQAQNDLTISEYMEDVGVGTDGWVNIDTTRVLTAADGEYSSYHSTVTFSSSVKPVTTGTLYYNETKLYIWGSNNDAQYFEKEGVFNSWGWYQIGTLNSA